MRQKNKQTNKQASMAPISAASKQMRRPKYKRKTVAFLVYLFFAFAVAAMAFSYRMILIGIHNQLEWQSQLESQSESESRLRSISTKTGGNRNHPQSKCAILLFGLPRAFKDFVLPSLEKNVIDVNRKYRCDYFVHFYQQDSEASGRSGKGGAIRSEDVFLLKDSVTNLHHADTQIPEVTFVSDTNETFWKQRGTLIQHYRTAKNKDGQYTFFPYGERTYEYPGTLDNIVKQWHSINAVWDAMEKSSLEGNPKAGNNDFRPHQYRRVAMMRNDVVYLTPIDIYSVPESNSILGDDFSSNVASVIPDFAKYPVNDRLIYGPHSAVKIWASQRFLKIEEYSRDPSATPGMVMHSETFLNASILQAIKETNTIDDNKGDAANQKFLTVLEDRRMCFLRVRADGAIWIEDCDASKSGFGGGYPGGMTAYRKLLDEFLPNKGRGCKTRRLKDKVRKILELACPAQTITAPK